MTVVGIDDTDSRTRGMCTTYLAARIADRLDTDRVALVRLAPGVEHKTRGNAALAVATDADPQEARVVARECVERHAAFADGRTSPGLAVTGRAPDAVPDEAVQFARDAMRSVVTLDRATRVARTADCHTVGWADGRRVTTTPDGHRRVERVETGTDPESDDHAATDATETDVVGRGRIGAVAAIAAWRAFASLGDRTYERLVYREPDRRGTAREVDAERLFAAAREAYPAAWDTVDRAEREAVCVPNTPGPVLFGIRGDEPGVVERVAERVTHEPPERSVTLVTNQGTDAHLAEGRIGETTDGRVYRLDGVVVGTPETREGGHVFCPVAPPESVSSGVAAWADRSSGVEIADREAVPAPRIAGDAPRVDCAAFEPTKRFRERLRSLRPGDRVTVCGQVSDDTCNVEKFAVRGLVRARPTTPQCPSCDRSMESAGRGQGYRCRDCNTHASGKVPERIDRELERGWYEVPPVARRHVAKPLVRGGFDAPTHPER